MADRNRRFTPAAVAMPLLFLAMSGLARAATITVSNTNDSGMGSLRAAITTANTTPTVATTVNFSVSGTITLLSALPEITNTSPGSLTIDGSGQAITVDGASTFQIFDVNAGATLNLQFLTLAHGFVLGNEEGEGAGGAIFNEGGTLTVTNCTFSDNQSTGSAVGGSGSGLPGQGGAIWSDGTLTVTNCTFSGNGATGGAGVTTGVGGGDGDGGAIYNDGGGLTVTNSTFAANQATGGVGDGAAGGVSSGGAIDIDFGAATVVNSTFSANQATGGSGSPGGDGDGGAIQAAAPTTVTNATFSGNRATAGAGGGGQNVGGAIDNDSSTVSVKGTILSSSNPANCGGSAITDAGYNISDDDTCGFKVPPSGTSVNDSTTLNLDPAGLQNNGGPTNTIALEGDSEAVHFIPVADCTDQSSPTPVKLTTDQRGFPRPDPGNPDFCDAGAFELQTMPIVISATGERLQIVHSSNPSGDQLNTAFTFTESGFPSCDAGDDAFNGIDVTIEPGSCGASGPDFIKFTLDSWVLNSVNHQTYGTFYFAEPPETLSVRMVELPTPAAPACGEWTINLEFAGIDLTPFGDGPFALILSNPDGDQGCFDITNAIVGNQIDPPSRSVRRGVRR
jgi:hypothetical protein